MKILLLSDSHGAAEKMQSVIQKESDCKPIFFLGDGEQDLKASMELFPNRKFLYVYGNCDSGHFLKNADYDEYFCAEGLVFVLTHGHKYSAKATKLNLLLHAQSVLANAICFGHTHVPFFQRDERSGIYLINPGSLFSGSYAVLEIENKTINVEFKFAGEDL